MHASVMRARYPVTSSHTLGCSTTRPFGRVWRVVVDAKTGATRACDALDAGARPRLGTPVPAASGDEGASFFATDMDDGALLRLEAGGAVVDTWRETKDPASVSWVAL